MSRIDFYQLSRDPAQRVIPLIAAKVLETGENLLVVCADADERAALSQALWEREAAFLAHGEAGEPQQERQPILLSGDCSASNGARIILVADGGWRDEATGFARVILLFGREQTGDARKLWSALGSRGHELRIFKQGDDGGWREGR